MTYDPNLLSAVAVLDADQPGWHRRVNLATLNLTNAKCVLGQTYGVGERPAHEDPWVKIFRRFDLGAMFTFMPPYEDQWKSLIAERQEADRIGETLSIPELDEVEGYERVTA